MSPGLFGKPFPAWTLVTVDPNSGDIKEKYPVAPAGKTVDESVDEVDHLWGKY